MSFLQMSLVGSVMILAVVIIRMILMHSMPKKVFIVLWGLVLLRLLLPFDISMPAGIFAIGQVQETAEPIIIFEPIDPAVLENTTNVNTWHYAQARIDQPLPATEQVTAAPSIMLLLTVVWLAGLTMFSIFFIVLYLKQHKKFLTSLPIENEFITNWQQTHKLKRQIRVRVSDRVTTPLTYGIWRPVILLPKNMNWADKQEIYYIMIHEFIHIKRFDAFKKLVLVIVLCVHWFNPFVWLMYVLFNRDLELSCDEGVIRLLGDKARAEYALTLIGAAEQKSYPHLYNAFGRYAIEERVHAIMRSRKTSYIGITAVLLLVLGIAIASATPTSVYTNYYATSARIIVITEDIPSDELICAETAATIGRMAFPRYFPAFAGDWEAWGDVTFLMGLVNDHGSYGLYERSTDIYVLPIWQGMLVVDTDICLRHNFPFVFSIHAKTGEVLQVSYAPRTRYALELEAARVEGEGAVEAIFRQWADAHPRLMQGRYNRMFTRLAEQTARELIFFDSEIVSVNMYRTGMMMSGPMGVVLVEYANGNVVRLEFLLLERYLISVKYSTLLYS